MRLELRKVLQENTAKDAKTSWSAFEQAYQHIVNARKLMERTVILGKAENNKKVQEIREKIRKRIKKPDGARFTEMDAYKAQQSSYQWNIKYIGFLRELQQIESTYLDFLSSRGIGTIDENDLEEIRLLAVAGTSAEQK